MNFDNSTVRRQDRLLTRERAVELLHNGEYGVMSMANNGIPYGIPVSYVFDGEKSIYIHCAPEGMKLKAISTCHDVSFCVVGNTKVMPSKFTTLYESVVAHCHAHTCLSDNERMDALKLLVTKYSPDNIEIGLKYAVRSFNRTEIIRLDILTISGKAKQATT